MAFYRSLLEEELDLGGVGEVDGADLIDDIADHDANTDEQIEAQAAEFGPSDGVDDLLDEMSIAIAESEMNYNKMMQAIGIWEASEMASGREVLYENTISDYLKRAKDWVINFFKKVWSVLQRYAKNIASVFHTNKGLATKYETEIKNGYKKYKDRKGEDNLKMYAFGTGLDNALKDTLWNNVKTKLNTIPTTKEAYKGRANDANDINSDDLADEFRAILCGKSGKISADDFRDEMKNSVGFGEKVKSLMEPTDVINALASGEAIKSAKKMMANSKKEFKEALSKLNTLEKNFAKDSTPEKAENIGDANSRKGTYNMQAVVRYSNALKSALSSVQVARSVILTAARARMSQARMFAHAYIGAYNRDKNKGFQKESAGYGFLSNIEFD